MTTYTAWGFDFAYGSGITTAELRAQGCQFVCRYLSGTPNQGKDLSSTEIVNYKAANINLVLNWELSGQMPNEAAGEADARSAQSEAATLANESGVPAIATAPIIFSADFDPTGNTGGIVAYMRGVASVLGHDRTGLYGGYDAMVAYFDANIGKYGWQTYAWSDGQWYPNAQLQQYQNDVQAGPATVDRDRATTGDYGYVKWALPKPTTLPGGPVAENADGRLEVFASGANNALYHIWQTSPGGAWAGWDSLAGTLTGDPAAVQNADGRLEVFTRGANNALYHIWQTSPGGAWAGWGSLGGSLQIL
jgi:Domain of unknown function (DUF1906)/Repeat of unknown function (DUF346)